MFFTHVGRVVAVLLLVFGIFRTTIGMLIATESLGPYEAALARYASGYSSSGALIDRGLYTVLASIVLGVLTEISYALRAQAETR